MPRRRRHRLATLTAATAVLSFLTASSLAVAQPATERISSQIEQVILNTSTIKANSEYASQGPEVLDIFGDLYFYLSTRPEEKHNVFDQPRERPLAVPNDGFVGGSTGWEARATMTNVPRDAQICMRSDRGIKARYDLGDSDTVIIPAGAKSQCVDVANARRPISWRLTGANGAWVSMSAVIDTYAQPDKIVATKVIDYWKNESGSAPDGEPNSLVILAHRGLFGSYGTGANSTTPENSLASLRAAEAAGLEGVEMDVRATANPDVPVIMHDSTLGRTTNVFDPSVSPNPPSSADLDTMTEEILGAGGVTLPQSISQRNQDRLTWTLTPEGAFSPYPQWSEASGFGKTYGRNPLVSSLSPESITSLNLLKFRDVAHPAPPLLSWNDASYLQTAADVSTEKVPTVDDILEELSTMKNPPVVVFDILQNQSLNAVAKIIANDDRSYAYNMDAKDLVILKYRGNIAPDLDKTIAELKQATATRVNPDGFVPNLVGIVAPYMKRGAFDPAAFQRTWIERTESDPGLPLIGMDIVQTAPPGSSGQRGAPLLEAAYEAGVSAGSFHDVPSYHGGADLYPKELIDKKLFLWQPGTCCRTSFDSGYPDGTKDLRYDFRWMIGRPSDTESAVNSGMITSDDALSVIEELTSRGLRDKAVAAYQGN